MIHSEKTYKTNQGFYNNHIKEVFGEMEVNKIKYSLVQSFADNLLFKDKKPKTVKNILTVLSNLLNLAIKDEIIDKNIVHFVELPKFDNTRYFDYPVSVQKEFLKAMLTYDEPIYKDIFLFLFHGRRRNEVLSIEFSMIDFEQRIYKIPAKINKAKRNQAHKMTDVLYARLYKHYLIACVNQETKFPVGFVFCNPFTLTRFYDLTKAWTRFLDKNNLPEIRLHDIRHLIGTYTTNTLELPIEKISHTLGHTDIKTTQRYITKKPDSSKEIIDDILNSLRSG
jgi:integrase